MPTNCLKYSNFHVTFTASRGIGSAYVALFKGRHGSHRQSACSRFPFKRINRRIDLSISISMLEPTGIFPLAVIYRSAATKAQLVPATRISASFGRNVAIIGDLRIPSPLYELIRVTKGHWNRQPP